MVGYGCHDTLTSIRHLRRAARSPSSNLRDQVMLRAEKKEKGLAATGSFWHRRRNFHYNDLGCGVPGMHPQRRGRGGSRRGLFLGEGIRGVISLFSPSFTPTVGPVCDTVSELPLRELPNPARTINSHGPIQPGVCDETDWGH